MSEEAVTSDGEIESVDQLVIGDGIYSEASASSYWVAKITRERVELRDKRDSPHVWVRDTFEASLDAHTWIRQSSGCSGVDPSSFGQDSGSD